jgi:hypothetical protein
LYKLTVKWIILTVVVVTPGRITRSLKASLIMAQAVLINFMYHIALLSTMVPMTSMASIGGTLASFRLHSSPNPCRSASSSPARIPEAKETLTSALTAMEAGCSASRIARSSGQRSSSGLLVIQVWYGLVVLGSARKSWVVRRRAENWIALLRDQNSVSSAHSR